MDTLISGLLYAVSRRCDKLARELDELHGKLSADDPRAATARAMARRLQSRMGSEAKETERLADGIQELVRDSVDPGPGLRRRGMSRYRGSVVDSRFVEYYVIPFLRNFDEQAMELTDICRRIAMKVNWPHGNWPLVAPGATSYFFFIAEHDEELILAPALAGTSLLPLPDLVHEMAHPLVRNSARRQTILGDWDRDEFVHDRVMATVGDITFGQMAAHHWLAHGVEEIACDVIAAWVCGPAYAWQHIRWCCGQRDGSSVYEDGDYHPPDHIRFEVIMRTLPHVAPAAEVDELTSAWDAVIGADEGQVQQPESGQQRPELYPPALVLELTDEVIQGCLRVGILPFPEELEEDDPRSAFDKAWREMRTDPRGYHDRSL